MTVTGEQRAAGEINRLLVPGLRDLAGGDDVADLSDARPRGSGPPGSR